jgi:hypothetical protein
VPELGSAALAAFSGYNGASPLTSAPNSVVARWTCPHLDASGPAQFMAIWVGVTSRYGGTSAPYVIQAGTQHSVSGLSPNSVDHFAWLEVEGDPGIPGFQAGMTGNRPVPLAVSPGDVVTIAVVRESVINTVSGLSIWRADFANTTTGQSGAWHFANRAAAPDPAGVWIACEAPYFGVALPYLPVPQFGDEQLLSCQLNAQVLNLGSRVASGCQSVRCVREPVASWT